MDEFEFVTGMESSFGPGRAGDDFQVEFDSDTIGLHAKVFDQGCNVGDTGDLAIFSINNQAHDRKKIANGWTLGSD
jgi:hypothetical protein